MVHGDLGRLFLVLLEKEGKGIDDLRPGGPVRVQTRAVLQHGIVLAQLWQEVVEGLDSASTENLIQDVDLGQELTSDFLETTRQLCNVSEGDLEVVT